MQMLPATARGMGHDGSAKDLLDAETNLKYGVRYTGRVPTRSPITIRTRQCGFIHAAIISRPSCKGMLDVLKPASPVETVAAPEPAPVAGNTAVAATIRPQPSRSRRQLRPPRNSLTRAIKSFFPRWSPCRSSGPK